MNTAQSLFDEAMAIADAVRRSEALCDLAFDAEQLAQSGRRSEAIALFELLATLDRYDDLLLPAIESADLYLVTLGVKSLSALDRIVADLQAKFVGLSDYQRLLSVAKTLVREHGKRQKQAWTIAKDLLAAAETIQPLGPKDLRFRSEVLQHTG